MRVIAFTADPSLSVALSMMGDLEVVVAHSQDEAVALAVDAGVMVVGLGGTDEGLEAVESIFSRGVTIPFVVVGDEEAPEGARAPVVTRPFSLDDIQHAVDRAMANGGSAHVTRLEPVQHEAPSVASVVHPEPVEPTPDYSIEEVDVPEPEPPSHLRVVEPEPVRERAPEPSIPADALVETAAAVAPRPEPPRAQPASEPPRPAPEPPRAAPQPKKRFGRRPAGAPSPAASESPIVRKLRSGARAAAEIEELLAELPVLADLGSMADALLNEIVQLFQPQTASVYMRGRDGFRVAASHGLSKVEEGLVVSESHSLFSELMRTPEAVLIAPVDLAQGLVAGIGGARTEALLAAPVSVEGRCVAVIVTGRKDFNDYDLQVIDDLAREAGPGLAIARLLDRLRAR